MVVVRRRSSATRRDPASKEKLLKRPESERKTRRVAVKTSSSKNSSLDSTSTARSLMAQHPGGKRAQNTRKVFRPLREKRIKPQSTVTWGTIFTNIIFSFFSLFFLFFVLTSSFFLVYGYRALTTSEYFMLKTIAVKGNSKITSRNILETAQLHSGTNVLAVSISAVEESLASNAWVKSVSVKRTLPSMLTVELSEKEPAFWFLHNGSLHYATEQGGIIAPLESGSIISLPTLEVEKGAEDNTDALPDLVRSLRAARVPLDMSRISLVRLSAARGVEVFVEGSNLKITIGLEEWLVNLDRLGRTLTDLEHRGELPKVRSIKVLGPSVWVETTDDILRNG